MQQYTHHTSEQKLPGILTFIHRLANSWLVVDKCYLLVLLTSVLQTLTFNAISVLYNQWNTAQIIFIFIFYFFTAWWVQLKVIYYDLVLSISL